MSSQAETLTPKQIKNHAGFCHACEGWSDFRYTVGASDRVFCFACAWIKCSPLAPPAVTHTGPQ